MPPDVPAGLPSALLERRPDIQQAEQQLVAANAQHRRRQGGVLPADLADRVGRRREHGAGGAVHRGGHVGGRRRRSCSRSSTPAATRSQVALAEARREEATLAYRQTIQQAFREVSDALVGYRQHARVPRDQQDAAVAAAQDARRLADLRYQGGATSYLEVLDSDTRLFIAELGLVQAQLGELSAFVEIYRALGGGWQS